MKKILWIGDEPDCPSGFGKATREILRHLNHREGGQFEVTVLGLNYRGDPSTVPYPVYAAGVGGDMFGVGRLIWMCDFISPDVIVIQNDGWNIPAYMRQLKLFKEYANIPVVAIVAVDGKNFEGKWLDGVTLAIFWTRFALNEAREGGYEGPATVIPLGVDTTIYRPIPKQEARQRRGLDPILDKFIVGNVNRNQPRKRWDLTIKYFAEWVQTECIDDAYLYLHTAPTGDTGINVKALAKYYGVLDRLALNEPPVWYGLPEADMADTYNCFDVAISTTQGEGMGLTIMEAMACGIPCLVPEWSAFADWARGAATLVPCLTTAIGPPYVNVIGGVPDQQLFTDELNRLYQNVFERGRVGDLGRECIEEPYFRWESIGKNYISVLEHVTKGVEVPCSAEP